MRLRRHQVRPDCFGCRLPTSPPIGVVAMNDWRMEEMENQVRFRDFNEWILESSDRMGNHQPTQEFICECSDGGCRQPVVLSREEYDLIRSNGVQFVLAINHENPELDRVVDQNDRFTTVHQLPGPGERRARETNPRV